MIFNNQGIFGFDISHYQDSNETPAGVNFNKMREYGASFVIIKAGQYNYVDSDFPTNWRESKPSGIPRGSYWFGDIGLPGKTQANVYYKTLLDNGYGGEMCAIDYEAGSWTNWNELYNFLVEFQRITNLPNEKIAIYTGYYYWLEHCPPAGASRDWFKKFPLWLANYNPIEEVKVPSPWTDCLIWQDGTPAIGLAAGVESKEIDHNFFNGDAEKFKTYFNSEPVNPGNGGTMSQWKEATGNITIRVGPGSTYAKATIGGVLQYVLDGDMVEVTEEQSGWGHISRIYRNNVKVALAPVSWCGTAYLVNTVYTPPSPVTTTLPVVLKGFDSAGLEIPNAVWEIKNVA
jgi:GH25 family lysozyme M1 (1,4-beta-N-acetylmuramidase)